MKFCPKCNKEYEDKFDFCSKCGFRLKDKEKHCPYCGKTLESNAEFCPFCGKNLKKEIHFVFKVNNGSSKSKNKESLSYSPKKFLIIVFVILLCVALYFGFGKDYLISKNFQPVDLNNCTIYVPNRYDSTKSEKKSGDNQLFSCMIFSSSVIEKEWMTNWYSVDVSFVKDNLYNYFSPDREERILNKIYTDKLKSGKVFKKEICVTKHGKKYLKVKSNGSSELFGEMLVFTGIYLANGSYYTVNICGTKDYVQQNESEIDVIFDMFIY